MKNFIRDIKKIKSKVIKENVTICYFINRKYKYINILITSKQNNSNYLQKTEKTIHNFNNLNNEIKSIKRNISDIHIHK